MEIYGSAKGRCMPAKQEWRAHDGLLSTRFHDNVLNMCVKKGKLPATVLNKAGITDAAFSAMNRGECPVLLDDAILAAKAIGCTVEELAL